MKKMFLILFITITGLSILGCQPIGIYLSNMESDNEYFWQKGEEYKIEFHTKQISAVDINLYKGNVKIKTLISNFEITENWSDNEFMFTPDNNLESGNDYSIEVISVPPGEQDRSKCKIYIMDKVEPTRYTYQMAADKQCQKYGTYIGNKYSFNLSDNGNGTYTYQYNENDEEQTESFINPTETDGLDLNEISEPITINPGKYTVIPIGDTNFDDNELESWDIDYANLYIPFYRPGTYIIKVVDNGDDCLTAEIIAPDLPTIN